jgi:hypothetical protein
MSIAWWVVEVVLGVIGSILVWVAIAGIISDARARRRARHPHPLTRPPARL